MADQMTNLIIPALRFDAVGDTKKKKGIFVVATYGTGKTHLMSTIAGVAEHANYAICFSIRVWRRQPRASQAGSRSSGSTSGATTLPLRDIVATEIHRGLAAIGVDFIFPDWSTVTNSKDHVHRHDGRLRGGASGTRIALRPGRTPRLPSAGARMVHVHDLAFLREIGEIAASTRFRLIAGLQEAIFDNPRFAGVADTIRRP